MIEKRREHDATTAPTWLQVLVVGLNALTKVADRFGVAFAVFIILLLAVRWMGSGETQDDFIRELLFGSVTGTRFITLFFVAILVVAIFGLDTRRRDYRTESDEMKRLSDEKTHWQEVALGRPLSHTTEKKK